MPTKRKEQQNYTFIGKHAEEYGINSAVILHTIIYFVLSNRKQKLNFHKGKYWVFNSSTKWIYFFPFLSQYQIYRCLKDLVKKGAIIEDSFNRKGYDKTLWHTLSDAVLKDCIKDSYWKNRMRKPLANLQKGTCKSARPIPNINTTIDTDVMDGVEPY